MSGGQKRRRPMTEYITESPGQSEVKVNRKKYRTYFMHPDGLDWDTAYKMEDILLGVYLNKQDEYKVQLMKELSYTEIPSISGKLLPLCISNIICEYCLEENKLEPILKEIIPQIWKRMYEKKLLFCLYALE